MVNFEIITYSFKVRYLLAEISIIIYAGCISM